MSPTQSPYLDALKQEHDVNERNKPRYEFVDTAKQTDSTTFYYVASSSYGELYLQLSSLSQHNNTSDVCAALALYHEEMFVQHLEHWLDCGLAFSPVAKQHIPSHCVYVDLSVPETILRNLQSTATTDNDQYDQSMNFDDDVTKETPVTSVPPVRLYLSIDSLVAAPAPDWSLLNVTWQALQADLYLSSVCLTDAEKETLVEGAVVVLPDSFHASWPVTLQSKSNIDLKTNPSANLFFQANYQLLTQATHAKTHSDSNNNNDGHKLDIMLQGLTIPVELLLPWWSSRKPAFGLDELICDVEFAMDTIALQLNDSQIAFGALRPVGKGYGVLINKVV